MNYCHDNDFYCSWWWLLFLASPQPPVWDVPGLGVQLPRAKTSTTHSRFWSSYSYVQAHMYRMGGHNNTLHGYYSCVNADLTSSILYCLDVYCDWLYSWFLGPHREIVVMNLLSRKLRLLHVRGAPGHNWYLETCSIYSFWEMYIWLLYA